MKRILRHVGGKDFKKSHQRKLDEQRAQYLEKREQEIQEENERERIKEISKPFKSDWRKEINLQESDWFPVDRGIANSTVQTFALYSPDSGIERTFSGLGGVETHPSTVVVDGETLDAPTYSQLAMQGYTPPLGGVQRQTQQTENERIDAEIRKLEEQIKQVTKLQYEYADKHSNEFLEITDRQAAEWDAYHQGLKDIDAEVDASFELFEKEKSALGPGPGPNGEHQWNRPETESEQAARIAAGGYVGPGGTWTFGAGGTVTVGETSPQLSALLNKHQATLDKLSERTMALMASKDKMQARHDKENIAHHDAYDKKNNSFETQKDSLKAKIAELEKQRPINQQLDAAQQAYPNLPFMGARVGAAEITALKSFGDLVTLPDKTLDTFIQGKGKNALLDVLAAATNLTTAKNALRSYNNFLANPTGPGSSPTNPLDITKGISPGDMNTLRNAVKQVQIHIDFAKQKNTPLAWETAANNLEVELNSATTDTSGLEATIKGSGTLDKERFIQSKGKDIRLNKTYAFRPGGSIAHLEKHPLGKIASAMGLKLDTLGPGGISVIAGPIASATMLDNLKGDIYDAPAAYMQIKIDVDTREKTQASQLAQQAVGRGPTPNRANRRRGGKKTQKESTTWERTKKHLKGA